MTPGRPVTVDLNADLGEDPAGADLALLDVVTTAHVACGGHAGDAELMRRAVTRALESGVALGAHPSYPDRDHFGRRELGGSPDTVAGQVAAQLDALGAVARACGSRILSVKAHGALYHRMARDPACTGAVVGAVVAFDPGLAVVLPALTSDATPEEVAARGAVTSAGLTLGSEAFCDRGYTAAGTLLPRSAPGAVITEAAVAARRACSMVLSGAVEAAEGTVVHLHPDTLCVHGDTPGARRLAGAVRQSLEAAGVRVAAPAR